MSSKRNGARVVVAATVAVLAGAGAVWAAGTRTQAEIRACIETATGHLYLPEAVAARPSRSPGATPGRPGPQAHTGPQGAPGPPGPAGVPGGSAPKGPPLTNGQ